MITHYDLFAGIGGNSIALEEVFTDEPIRHIFCEWESFPTAVLKQHWPTAEYFGDIADLVTYTNNERLEGRKKARNTDEGREESEQRLGKQSFCIVTGGFPCQPFSVAGQRRGTADDRYKWPEMFAVIRNVRPDWVVAENVRGLVTWNDGLVLEQVCTDLESEGYEVQPIIIPAVAVNAPHRRDRVWIIGHRPNTNRQRERDGLGEVSKRNDHAKLSNADQSIATDAGCQYGESRSRNDLQPQEQETNTAEREYPDWSRNWQEVAFATCNDSMDDGLPRLVDGVSYSRAKWRKDSLKAYGNAIVPQVAMQIFQAIKESEDEQ